MVDLIRGSCRRERFIDTWSHPEFGSVLFERRYTSQIQCRSVESRLTKPWVFAAKTSCKEKGASQCYKGERQRNSRQVSCGSCKLNPKVSVEEWDPSFCTIGRQSLGKLLSVCRTPQLAAPALDSLLLEKDPRLPQGPAVRPQRRLAGGTEVRRNEPEGTRRISSELASCSLSTKPTPSLPHHAAHRARSQNARNAQNALQHTAPAECWGRRSLFPQPVQRMSSGSWPHRLRDRSRRTSPQNGRLGRRWRRLAKTFRVSARGSAAQRQRHATSAAKLRMRSGSGQLACGWEVK